MARYIDADKLIAHLKDEIKACDPVFRSRAYGKNVAYGTQLGLKSAISFAETLPTADVAPKSEVAREIIDFIKGRIKAMEDHTPGENLDQAIGIVDWILSGVIDDLEEKYTEGAK